MISIAIAKEKDLKEWDLFVDQSNNGTIFHKMKFLSYHPKSKFKFNNLIFRKNNNIVALLPGGIVNGDYISPIGASYGSLVTKNIPLAEVEEITDHLIIYAKKHNIKNIFLTPPPDIYNIEQTENQKYMLLYKGFKLHNCLITHAVNLGCFNNIEDYNKIIPNRTKRQILKSQKSSIQIKISSDFESFYAILLKNKEKFDVMPTHKLDELVRIKDLFPKELFLFLAYDENNIPVAGVCVFGANSKVALNFYIAHLYEYREYRAISRTLYEVVSWAKNQGFAWLDFGVSMDTFSKNPMEPSRSLIYFKEGFGTYGFLRQTFHKKI